MFIRVISWHNGTFQASEFFIKKPKMQLGFCKFSCRAELALRTLEFLSMPPFVWMHWSQLTFFPLRGQISFFGWRDLALSFHLSWHHTLLGDWSKELCLCFDLLDPEWLMRGPSCHNAGRWCYVLRMLAVTAVVQSGNGELRHCCHRPSSSSSEQPPHSLYPCLVGHWAAFFTLCFPTSGQLCKVGIIIPIFWIQTDAQRESVTGPRSHCYYMCMDLKHSVWGQQVVLPPPSPTLPFKVWPAHEKCIPGEAHLTHYCKETVEGRPGYAKVGMLGQDRAKSSLSH